MSLFGGLDMGTPADRNRHALTRELETRRTRTDRPGRIYPNGAELLLMHGSFAPGRRIPDHYLPLLGEMSACFWNALAAAKADPSLRYCEGLTGTGNAFIAHAWCLDPTGGVVEVTYPPVMMDGYGIAHDTRLPILPVEHWAYWGVTFTTDLVEHHREIADDEFPMLGRDNAVEGMVSTGGLGLQPPKATPALDVRYYPDRTRFP